MGGDLWISAAFIAPTLAGSWVNYDSTFNTQAGYYQDDSGNIWLRGLVKSGSGLIFTLPAGYRPPKYLRFPVSTLSGATLTLGEVTIGSTATFPWGQEETHMYLWLGLFSGRCDHNSRFF